MATAPSPPPELPEAELPPEAGASAWLTAVATAVDAFVFRAMRRAVDALLLPDPARLPALRASAEPLLDPELASEPARYFDFGSEARAPREERARLARSLGQGVAFRRSLRAPLAPFVRDPELARVAARPEVEVLEFEHWAHEPGPPVGTVICLHGFTMGRPRIDAPILMASAWFERGLDVLLPTLPFHGARTPADARFSGEHFAIPDVARLGEAVRRALFEIDLLLAWVRRRRPGPVGLLGLSLGGYLAALHACVRGEADFVIPVVPPACFGDLAWRFFEGSRAARAGAEAAFSREELRAAFRVHSPLAHPPRMPRERALVVAGRGDRIVPPEHPHALHLHLGRARVHWFSGSHLLPLGRGGIVRAVEEHLAALGVLS